MGLLISLSFRPRFELLASCVPEEKLAELFAVNDGFCPRSGHAIAEEEFQDVFDLTPEIAIVSQSVDLTQDLSQIHAGKSSIVQPRHFSAVLQLNAELVSLVNQLQ